MSRTVHLVFFIILGGCGRVVEPDPPASETQYRLRIWAETVARVINGEQDDVHQYETLEEVITSWKKKELIEPWTLSTLWTDYWNQEFKWEVRKEGLASVVRISSAGRNGIWENQTESDDLFVEIRAHGKGESEIRFSHKDGLRK